MVLLEPGCGGDVGALATAAAAGGDAIDPVWPAGVGLL
jgi:hypothetical protein